MSLIKSCILLVAAQNVPLRTWFVRNTSAAGTFCCHHKLQLLTQSEPQLLLSLTMPVMFAALDHGKFLLGLFHL